MLKLQHMNPERLRRPNNVPMNGFNGMIGNAMPVNIVEVVLVMLSRSCPSVLGNNAPLPDRWSA